MSGVIIACKDNAMCEKLRSVLTYAGIEVLGTVSKGASAIHIASRYYEEGGVILCSYAMSDMTASELYKIKPDNFEMVVLLTARQFSIFRGKGMLCLNVPINRNDLIETLGMLIEHKWTRLNNFGRKDLKPVERTEEEKALIFKAKALLMDRNNMTEPDAHRFMQKKSMDSGDTLVSVAQKILNGVL